MKKPTYTEDHGEMENLSLAKPVTDQAMGLPRRSQQRRQATQIWIDGKLARVLPARAGGARPGSGRKPSGRLQYVTRLNPRIIRRIKTVARQRGVPECHIVESALDTALA